MPLVKLIGLPSPFLNENSGLDNKNCSYPYPSKIPTFIAENLNTQLEHHWKKLKKIREHNFRILLDEFRNSDIKSVIPNGYFDDKNKIVPLRLVICDLDNIIDLKNSFKNIIAIDEVWFQSPIVSRNIPLTSYGFDESKNKKSIKMGKNILNIPLDLDEKNLKTLVNKIRFILNKKQFK
jgi:hypothetical protein